MADMKHTKEVGYKDASLKPCPFCGFEEPRRHEVKETVMRGDKTFTRTWYRVHCPACGVMTTRAVSPTMANCDWNNRV